jgi:hypothetical protein
MLRRTVSAALLSLSLSLTGCVAYELDERGYSNSRYPSYGDSRFAYPDVRERYDQSQNSYPIIRYSQYPQPQNDRYRTQRQPVYYYRQVPAGYWPAHAWQGDDGHKRHRRDRHAERERERYENRYYDTRYPEHERYQRGHEPQRGWTLRIN